MRTVTYIIPATLLYEAAAYLQPPEKLAFVAGVRLFGERIIVLTQLVFVMFKATRVGAEPDYPSRSNPATRLN